MTFDVDGDGVVSQEDFYTSNRFDENCDGVIQEDEQHDLRKQLVQDTIDRYMELPHKMKEQEVSQLIDAMTEDIDATVDDAGFKGNLLKLNNATAVSRTFDSKKVHRAVQPYPNIAKPKGSKFHSDAHNYGPPKTPSPLSCCVSQADERMCCCAGLKRSEILRTPTYDIDTYRPYTHRTTGKPTRSSLFDKRANDTRKQLDERLDSPPEQTMEGHRVDRHKRTSMAHEAKPFGLNHFGLTRTDIDTFAHASIPHGGGHVDEDAHETRPVRIQGRGTHFSLSGPKAGVQEEARRMEPLSFLYHGLCERRPENGARIR